MVSTYLDSTYKWHHMVLIFLCLAYFTQHNAFKVHPCCCIWQDFLFYMAELYSIVPTDHNFFINFSSDEHLGFFHISDIVSNTVVNIYHLSVCLLKMSVQFLCLVFFFLLSCMSSYFYISFLSDMWFVNIFSHIFCCIFILLIISFVMQKLFRIV